MSHLQDNAISLRPLQVVAGLLCAMVLIASGCAANEVWINEPFIVRDLPLTSLRGGRWLRIEQIRGNVLPLAAGQKAMLVNAVGESRPINNLRDLEGFVRIENEGQAVEFVRLFTAEDTWFLSDDACMIDVEVTDSRVRESAEDYGAGRISLSEWNEYQLGSPLVRGDDSGFVVERFVVNEDGHVLCIEESVSRIGEYTRRVIRVVTENARITPPILY